MDPQLANQLQTLLLDQQTQLLSQTPQFSQFNLNKDHFFSAARESPLLTGQSVQRSNYLRFMSTPNHPMDNLANQQATSSMSSRMPSLEMNQKAPQGDIIQNQQASRDISNNFQIPNNSRGQSEDYIESNRENIIRNYLKMAQHLRDQQRSSSSGNQLEQIPRQVQNLNSHNQLPMQLNGLNQQNHIFANPLQQSGFNPQSNQLNSLHHNYPNSTSQFIQDKNDLNILPSKMNVPVSTLIQSIIQQQQQQEQQIQQQQQQYQQHAMNQQISSSASLIQNILRECTLLQQRIADVSQRIALLSQKQSELLSIGDYASNKVAIEYIQEQLQGAWDEKKKCLDQLESFTTFRIAQERQQQQHFQNLQQQHQQQQQLMHMQQMYQQQQQQQEELLQRQQTMQQFQRQQQQQNQIELKNLQFQTIRGSFEEIQRNAIILQNQQGNNLNVNQNERTPLVVEEMMNQINSREKLRVEISNEVSSKVTEEQDNQKPENLNKDQANKVEENQKEIKNSQEQSKQNSCNHEHDAEESKIVPNQEELQKTTTTAELIPEKETTNSPALQSEPLLKCGSCSTAESPKEQKSLIEQEDLQAEAAEDEEIDIAEEQLQGKQQLDADEDLEKPTTAGETLNNCTGKDKKADKRFERLAESVEDILGKEEGACSKIKPIALEMCKTISKMNEVLKNRPYEAIAAAIIVHASRVVASPITVKNMAKITQSKEKIINRVFMYLKQNVEGFHNKMPSPGVFIANICHKLKFSENIEKTAILLQSNCHELSIVKGQHAATIAACLVKLAASLYGIDLTVKQICEASNVCQISLRLLYRQIFPHRMQLVGDHAIPNISLNQNIVLSLE